MATQSQLTANRLNAQHSTGPVTAEGKAASSRNALKSGLFSEAAILPGESPDAFKDLQSDYTQRYHPTTPDERFYVDQMIRNEWLLRRFHRIEESMWISQTKSLDLTDPAALGDFFVKAPPAFARLERRIRAAERAYQKAHDELVKLRKPTKESAVSPELGSFRQPDPDSPTFERDMELYIAQMKIAMQRKALEPQS